MQPGWLASVFDRSAEEVDHEMSRSNLPGPGEIFLDHLGHFIVEARAGAASLREAGFTVTPFSAQMVPDPRTGRPVLSGTGNICVMLRAGYLEFLVHTADTPIGLEFKEALGRRAGLHLAAFAVSDAEACHARLAEEGWPMRPLVRMSRSVASVEGTAQARFTVARPEKGTMPEGRIQTLTHHSEAAMWQERWLEHRNGAAELQSLLVSSPGPDETAARFSRLLGRPATRATSGAVRLELDRGVLEILPEADARELVGEDVEPGRSVLVGYRLGVDELSRSADALAAAGLPVRRRDGAAIAPFPPALGRGVWVLSPTGDVAR